VENFTSTERLVFKVYTGGEDNLVKEVTQQFIGYIVSGQLVPGYIFPSVTRMHQAMQISKINITKILKNLSAGAFIIWKNGKAAQVSSGSFAGFNAVYDGDVVNAQGLLNPDRGHVYNKNKLFMSKLFGFEKYYPLTEREAIYPLLLEESCQMLNNSRNTSFNASEVYYLYNLKNIYTNICLALHDKKSVFLVPENYSVVKRILKRLGMKTILLKVDDQGICIDQIDKHCASGNVRGVFFQAHSALPIPVDTAEDRIFALRQLQIKHQFKVIENGGYLPRESTKESYLLKLFKDSPDGLIYIWQLTMMQRETKNLFFVRSSTNFVQKIRESAADLGSQLNLPVAFAIREMIIDKSYADNVKGNTAAVSLLFKTIREIFLYDYFWDESTIKFGNDTAFYLKPKSGYFTPHVFKKLWNAKGNFVDPSLYVVEKKPLKGIWLDFSFYLDHKHFRLDIVAFEKILRAMVKRE